MDREDAALGGFEATPRSTARITPDDVQRKEFGTARVRAGYLMHEVDGFLDEITDTLSSLLSENERLRAQLAASPAPAPDPPPAAARPADRAAVEAFLQREKAFLQSLGSLVQEHAEDLKGMVRSARAVPSAAPAMDAPAAEVAAPARSAEPASMPPSADPEPDASPPAAGGSLEASDDADANDVDAEDEAAAILDRGEADTRALDPVEAEEPIVVAEPEPTGTRRREQPSDGSLRELFWGEE